MIISHRAISAYLGKPRTKPRGRLAWQGFRTQFIEIRRDNPQITSQLIAALIIWCAGISAFQNLVLDPKPASDTASTSTVPNLAANTTNPPTASPAAFAKVVQAKILPSGPSGQLLPPGTMAPPKTYPNSYTPGQCTWYVAGRRQIPSGWGNAVSWYYHASASGWSVGTTPAVAAIAWTASGRYGHVALVERVSADGTRVYLSEMNYRGAYVTSNRWVSAKSFKYIY